MNTNTIQAKQWITVARSFHGNVERYLQLFLKHQRKAKTSYEKLGTTATEIQKLRIDGYKAEAIKWLGLARDHQRENATRLRHFERFRKRVGLSYEDLGTTAEEVEQLKQAQAA